MLSGRLPFSGDEKKLNQCILSGSFNFSAPGFKSVSSSALRVIRQMLQVNPEKRSDVDQLLNSKWLQDENARQFVNSILAKHGYHVKTSTDDLEETLINVSLDEVRHPSKKMRVK
jgi:serine/threonine protein kinase